MGTRFILESRFRGDETVQAQLLKNKLAAQGYRYRPAIKTESDGSLPRFQRFEKKALEDDNLSEETSRLKESGVWANVRSLRLV
ncbi:MAG: hypothetical protein VKP72_03035 [bacterium]|jgi:hypothetical protein|nr:hypothetical protein [bacterium]